MFAMRGSTLIGVAMLVWVVWIVLATNSQGRIERGCQPVLWAGNVVTSLTQLTVSQYQDSVHEFFLSTDYACRFTLWRLLHEESWQEYQREVEGDALDEEGR